MREVIDQNNSEYEHFLSSDSLTYTHNSTVLFFLYIIKFPGNLA